MQLLLAVATAAAAAAVATVVAAVACGYRVDDCDQPMQRFTLDEALDEHAVERLVTVNHVIDRIDLECEVVCESIYLDQNPQGAATSVEVCELKIDGDFTGDPKAVVGSLYCEGHGISQFCVDG